MMMFSCDECDRSFLKKSKLNRHVRETHRNLKVHTCEECGKTFKRNSHLKRHLISHSANPKPHKCAYAGCYMAFTCKHHLERHIKIIHTNECTHKCPECSDGFAKKQSLNKHLTFDHGKKKPQICALCNEDFFTIGQLDLHECEQQFLEGAAAAGESRISANSTGNVTRIRIRRKRDSYLEFQQKSHEEQLQLLQQSARKKFKPIYQENKNFSLDQEQQSPDFCCSHKDDEDDHSESDSRQGIALETVKEEEAKRDIKEEDACFRNIDDRIFLNSLTQGRNGQQQILGFQEGQQQLQCQDLHIMQSDNGQLLRSQHQNESSLAKHEFESNIHLDIPATPHFQSELQGTQQLQMQHQQHPQQQLLSIFGDYKKSPLIKPQPERKLSELFSFQDFQKERKTSFNSDYGNLTIFKDLLENSSNSRKHSLCSEMPILIAPVMNTTNNGNAQHVADMNSNILSTLSSSLLPEQQKSSQGVFNLQKLEEDGVIVGLVNLNHCEENKNTVSCRNDSFQQHQQFEQNSQQIQINNVGFIGQKQAEKDGSNLVYQNDSKFSSKNETNHGMLRGNQIGNAGQFNSNNNNNQQILLARDTYSNPNNMRITTRVQQQLFHQEGNNDKNTSSQLPKRKEEKCYQCFEPGCDKFYTKMSNLKTHIRTYHFKRKDFQCYYPGCQSAYLHKKSLNEHIARVHRGVTGDSLHQQPNSSNNKQDNHRHNEEYNYYYEGQQQQQQQYKSQLRTHHDQQHQILQQQHQSQFQPQMLQQLHSNISKVDPKTEDQHILLPMPQQQQQQQQQQSDIFNDRIMSVALDTSTQQSVHAQLQNQLFFSENDVILPDQFGTYSKSQQLHSSQQTQQQPQPQAGPINYHEQFTLQQQQLKQQKEAASMIKQQTFPLQSAILDTGLHQQHHNYDPQAFYHGNEQYQLESHSTTTFSTQPPIDYSQIHKSMSLPSHLKPSVFMA